MPRRLFQPWGGTFQPRPASAAKSATSSIVVRAPTRAKTSRHRELAARVARALHPGGVYAVLDEFRPRSAKDAGQVGALLEFYFALTSQSGTWAVEEISHWQRQAGLSPRRPIRLRTAPGVGIQAAFKPG
jgi:hypothetical protein